jgi:hypothetical protein
MRPQKFPLLRTFTIAVLAAARVLAAEATSLKPLMAVPDKVVLHEDFATARPLEKAKFMARQGTRWTVAHGVVRGVQSSPEFQAKKQDHFGYEPRLSIPACPQEYVIAFDVRFIGGKPTAIVPFVEFGHHIARVAWAGGGGAKLVVDHESTQIDAAPDFKIEDGKWYRALAELKGDEIILQFAGGPTLYGQHAALTGKNDGFGVAGKQGGTVELDNITVWSVKPEVNPQWAAKRATLRKAEPVVVKQKSAPKKKQPSP